MRFPQLYEMSRGWTEIPKAQWLAAEARGVEQSFAKRELFMRAGDAADRFALVLEGVFRAVRVSAKGEETVKAFRAEHELIGPYAEMLQGVPSLTRIEALEPSRVLTFKAADFRALEAGHPCWTQVARKVAEYHFIVKERREQEFLDLSAEERLDQFWAEHARLEGRLAQRDVAAYLGITEVAMSRIMSRRRKRG